MYPKSYFTCSARLNYSPYLLFWIACFGPPIFVPGLDLDKVQAAFSSRSEHHNLWSSFIRLCPSSRRVCFWPLYADGGLIFEGSHIAVGSWLLQFMLCRLNSTTLELSGWVCHSDKNAQLSHLRNIHGDLSHIQLNSLLIIGNNAHNGLNFVVAFLMQAASSAQLSVPPASLAEWLRGLSASALPSGQQQTWQRSTGRQADQAPAPLACHSRRSGWWGFGVRWRVAGREMEETMQTCLSCSNICLSHHRKLSTVSTDEATMSIQSL